MGEYRDGYDGPHCRTDGVGHCYAGPLWPPFGDGDGGYRTILTLTRLAAVAAVAMARGVALGATAVPTLVPLFEATAVSAGAASSFAGAISPGILLERGC